MSVRSLHAALVLVSLTGCATTQSGTTAPTETMSTWMLLPRYATHVSEPTLGGAAWRGGGREHALALDGQCCGLSARGRLRCRHPAAQQHSTSNVDSTTLPLPDPAPSG